MEDWADSSHEDELVIRALGGDQAAFGEMAQRASVRVRGYLRRAGVPPSDLDDLAQDVFSAVFVAFRGGRYEHRTWFAFLAWLRTISERLPARRPPLVRSLDVEIADPGRGPQARAESRELARLLATVLDEALIEGATSPRDRSLAILRRVAFVLWYVDGLPHPKILNALHGIGVGLEPPVSVSPSTLNNWLSRGDLLRQVVRHLVASRPDLLTGLAADATIAAVVIGDDRGLARLLLQQRLSEAEIAAQLGMTPSEVAKRVQQVRTAVSQYLTTRIKAELHRIRHSPSRKGMPSVGRSHQGEA